MAVVDYWNNSGNHLPPITIKRLSVRVPSSRTSLVMGKFWRSPWSQDLFHRRWVLALKGDNLPGIQYPKA